MAARAWLDGWLDTHGYARVAIHAWLYAYGYTRMAIDTHGYTHSNYTCMAVHVAMYEEDIFAAT